MTVNTHQGLALTAGALEAVANGHGDIGDLLIVARELRSRHGDRELLQALKKCLPSCTRSTDYSDAFAEYREAARCLAVNICTLRFHDRIDDDLPFQLRHENLSIGDDAAEGRRWLVEVETALLGALWRCLEAHEAEPVCNASCPCNALRSETFGGRSFTQILVRPDRVLDQIRRLDAADAWNVRNGRTSLVVTTPRS